MMSRVTMPGIILRGTWVWPKGRHIASWSVGAKKIASLKTERKRQRLLHEHNYLHFITFVKEITTVIIQMKATLLSCGAVYYAAQGGSNFWVCGWNPKVWTIQMKATEQYFLVVLFIMLYNVVLSLRYRGLPQLDRKLLEGHVLIILLITLNKTIPTTDCVTDTAISH